jgi:hypothetical protein
MTKNGYRWRLAAAAVVAAFAYGCGGRDTVDLVELLHRSCRALAHGQP